MTIVDCHTHIRGLKTNFKPLFKLGERLGYDKLAVMSLQCTGNLLQNLTCVLCKENYPGKVYAFGGLDYLTGKSFVDQVKTMREMGFDGIKMLEGKPTTRKLLGYALDDPMYDDYFSYCEETGFPVLLHIADPPEFWDESKAPSWAVERGWCYDETHVPFARYYTEIENMLNKHPKLKAIFADFYFLSGEPEQAQKFLDDHPNVAIDITAGIEMYENFSLDTKFWRGFFIKNAGRLVFGTDSSDAEEVADASGDKVDLGGYAAMEIEFVRTDKEIDIYGKKIKGIGLPEDVQKKIFAENFYGFVGDTPKKTDKAAIKKEAEYIRGFLKKDEDLKDLEFILKSL